MLIIQTLMVMMSHDMASLVATPYDVCNGVVTVVWWWHICCARTLSVESYTDSNINGMQHHPRKVHTYSPPYFFGVLTIIPSLFHAFIINCYHLSVKIITLLVVYDFMTIRHISISVWFQFYLSGSVSRKLKLKKLIFKLKCMLHLAVWWCMYATLKQKKCVITYLAH